MDQIPIEEKKSFLQNDRLLVCGMLVIYGVCILGVVGATLWSLDRRSKTIAAHATATAFALPTEQANATSTAFALATQQTNVAVTVIARKTEQAQYELVDPFDNNHENWWVRIVDDENMRGSVKIIGGAYLWDIQKVKQPFIDSSVFHQLERVEDFDVYVDSKIVAEHSGDACSGLVFRLASFDWEQGAYTFSVCRDSTFNVYYYQEGEWESIVRHTYSSAIRNSEWNRLEISARGDNFTFLINHEVVFEMTDDRQPRGGLALYIDVNQESPLSISFDNFGLQTR
ncbi:MAG TPA: family 16 glycoside hydrolase [Anaerolineales bacterium]|nr:family 16 glycoside hydrolase [Anaerolineales bacterium]